MKKVLKPNGELVLVNGHNIHVFRDGNINAPKIIFMPGHCVISPVYDFKELYEKLLNNFRIIVVEKFGYGYSDIWDAPCDIDSLVNEQREALMALGETGPFILAPHSMSGLEAMRWKQLYPDEVSGIIGIDMANPMSYNEWTEEQIEKTAKSMESQRWLARLLLRVKSTSLTTEEYKQHKLLKKRNVFNKCTINEAKEVLKNSKIVEEAGNIKCPSLLFVSNGEGQEKGWIQYQEQLALDMGAKIIKYDCNHCIHYYKSEEMAKEIIEYFANK